jgi:uncharacterized protein involved in exopolysaccharide biosynthesis
MTGDDLPSIQSSRGQRDLAKPRAASGSAEMLENLEIRQVRGTTFIDLTYRGTDRKKATQTVNTLARVSSERLGWQSGVGDSSSEREITGSTPSTQPT